MPQGRLGLAACSSNSYGFFGGGKNPSVSPLVTVDRIDFSIETTSAPGYNLTQARQDMACSIGSYGYFGGFTPSYVTQ